VRGEKDGLDEKYIRIEKYSDWKKEFQHQHPENNTTISSIFFNIIKI
jgi:hypothetical protein